MLGVGWSHSVADPVVGWELVSKVAKEREAWLYGRVTNGGWEGAICGEELIGVDDY